MMSFKSSPFLSKKGVVTIVKGYLNMRDNLVICLCEWDTGLLEKTKNSAGAPEWSRRKFAEQVSQIRYLILEKH